MWRPEPLCGAAERGVELSHDSRNGLCGGQALLCWRGVVHHDFGLAEFSGLSRDWPLASCKGNDGTEYKQLHIVGCSRPRSKARHLVHRGDGLVARQGDARCITSGVQFGVTAWLMRQPGLTSGVRSADRVGEVGDEGVDDVDGYSGGADQVCLFAVVGEDPAPFGDDF